MTLINKVITEQTWLLHPSADCTNKNKRTKSTQQSVGGLSLERLDVGGLEAGELQLHAALKLVQQLLQQPGEERKKKTDVNTTYKKKRDEY